MSYVGLSVQIHGTDQSPEEVRAMVEQIIRENREHDYLEDIEVNIEEFSGTE